MRPLWRKANTSHTYTTLNNDENHYNYNSNHNDTVRNSHKNSNNNHEWSNQMASTHLPIYPVSMNYHEMPQLYSTISDSIDCVLLGESTHGTKEFYQLRSMITKYLILNKGFTAIFVEMDWPKLYKINEYITSDNPNEGDINKLFSEINEYPLWMYRNNIFKELIIWLKHLNHKLKSENKPLINLYGIDMQSYKSFNKLKKLYHKYKQILPNSSMIISFLEALNLNTNTQNNQYEMNYIISQIDKIYNLFLSTSYHAMYHNNFDPEITEIIHNIDQNFLNLQSALKYFTNDCDWDIRDIHWFKSIEKYFYYKSNGRYLGYNSHQNEVDDKGKIILWAHNSHVCNADFTNYAHSNIGAILKNQYGQNKVFTLCFDSYKGSVTATRNRNEYPQFFILKSNVKESFGKLFHQKCKEWHENNLMIFLKNGVDKMKDDEVFNTKYFVSIKDVKTKRKIRDIGVCYNDEYSYSHCSNGNILQLADVLIFINKSNALEPFEQDKDTNWDKNKRVYDAVECKR